MNPPQEINDEDYVLQHIDHSSLIEDFFNPVFISSIKPINQNDSNQNDTNR